MSKNRSRRSLSETVERNWEAARATALELIRIFGPPPRFGVVLGSGLLRLGQRFEARVAFRDLPLPKPETAFHKGQIGVVQNRGRRLLVVEGRAHMYDGYTAQQVTVLVAALSFWGLEQLLSTGICGALASEVRPGQWVTFSGHLNLTGDTCYWPGPSSKKPTRGVLETRIRKRVFQSLTVAGIRGPSLPTAMEYRVLEKVGAQAVSMSAVPERLAARQLALDHACFYLVTDYWDGSRFVGGVKEAKRLARSGSGYLWETVYGLLETSAELGDV